MNKTHKFSVLQGVCATLMFLAYFLPWISVSVFGFSFSCSVFEGIFKINDLMQSYDSLLSSVGYMSDVRFYMSFLWIVPLVAAVNLVLQWMGKYPCMAFYSALLSLWLCIVTMVGAEAKDISLSQVVGLGFYLSFMVSLVSAVAAWTSIGSRFRSAYKPYMLTASALVVVTLLFSLVMKGTSGQFIEDMPHKSLVKFVFVLIFWMALTVSHIPFLIYGWIVVAVTYGGQQAAPEDTPAAAPAGGTEVSDDAPQTVTPLPQPDMQSQPASGFVLAGDRKKLVLWGSVAVGVILLVLCSVWLFKSCGGEHAQTDTTSYMYTDESGVHYRLVPGYAYEFRGSIDGKYPFTMNLHVKTTGVVCGTNFYDSQGGGSRIDLFGRVDDNTLTLSECDENGREMATFKGTSETPFEGIWNRDGQAHSYTLDFVKAALADDDEETETSQFGSYGDGYLPSTGDMPADEEQSDEYEEAAIPPPPAAPVVSEILEMTEDFEEVETQAEREASEETVEEPAVQEDNTVYPTAEVMPSFPGGDAALMNHLANSIRYPAIAQENGVQGRVVCSFIVEKDGSLSEVKVLRGVDPSLDKEAVRVIRSLPRWTPGRQNDRTVRVKYSLPVSFRLQ